MTNSYALNFAIRQDEDGATAINSATGKSISFNINNSGKMMLDSNGNLGIGVTPDSSYKLDVNGNTIIVAVQPYQTQL